MLKICSLYLKNIGYKRYKSSKCIYHNLIVIISYVSFPFNLTFVHDTRGVLQIKQKIIVKNHHLFFHLKSFGYEIINIFHLHFYIHSKNKQIILILILRINYYHQEPDDFCTLFELYFFQFCYYNRFYNELLWGERKGVGEALKYLNLGDVLLSQVKVKLR